MEGSGGMFVCTHDVKRMVIGASCNLMDVAVRLIVHGSSRVRLLHLTDDSAAVLCCAGPMLQRVGSTLQHAAMHQQPV